VANDAPPAVRRFSYTLNIECASEGNADMTEVEKLLDLHFQDLVMDDTFVNELDEKQAVTIQVIPNFGKI
jgi:archaellin